MAARYDLTRMQNLSVKESRLDVVAILGAACGWVRVERDVSGLRADHHAGAVDDSVADRLLNRQTNRTFGPLTSVVKCRVDQVDASLDRAADRFHVRGVIRISALAEISANTKGGNAEVEGRLAEIDACVAVRERCCAEWCRAKFVVRKRGHYFKKNSKAASVQ